jgi:hypothetical protein
LLARRRKIAIENLVFGCAGRLGIFDSTFPSIINLSRKEVKKNLKKRGKGKRKPAGMERKNRPGKYFSSAGKSPI